MEVSGVDAAERPWHIVRVKGNLATDPDPFRVRIVPMTVADSDALDARIVERSIQGDETVIASRVKAQIRDLFARHVEEVAGLAVTIDGKRVEPTNGAQLFDALQRCRPAFRDAVINDVDAVVRGASSVRAAVVPTSGS